jgi:hypothetical protein
MEWLNDKLLFSSIQDDDYLLYQKANTPRGVYNPMQFVLRLREDVHHVLDTIEPGILIGRTLTPQQNLAFSTYFHETIHWWQHVGSNFGLISSLKYPAQAHINHNLLKSFLASIGPIKSVKKYAYAENNADCNRIINNWHDIEYAGQIAFDPKRLTTITESPYFDSWGHSYALMWTSTILTLETSIDPQLTFLSNVRLWEDGFRKLRDQKVQSFYFGSHNKIPPFGTKAIFEGQARIAQLQYLTRCQSVAPTMSKFHSVGLLSGIYAEALEAFLDILDEDMPTYATDSLIGLFLLVCDAAINPTDGFPFDLTHFESFIIANDPGYRFILITQMIRDKFPALKKSIQRYSKEEYIEVGTILAESISCFSPYDSTSLIYDWIQTKEELGKLLEEERQYNYKKVNTPIRLFFSKFLRFQIDKFHYPEFFCWPGMNFSSVPGNTVDLSTCYELFERHRALFIADPSGTVLHSAIEGLDASLLDDNLNDFFSWNCVYDLVRQWISEEGTFKYNYQWLTKRGSQDEMVNWAVRNFSQSFGFSPMQFKVI